MELKFESNAKTNTVHPELLHFKLTKEALDYENIRPQITATIVPRRSKLEINFAHKQPALMGEWYEVCVHMDNKENKSIDNLEVTLFLIGEENPSSSK